MGTWKTDLLRIQSTQYPTAQNRTLCFFSLPPKVTFLGITHFFYNCLHTHIRFTLPACLRPERFLSLCKSSYLFSGLACVKLLTISRRELIRNAAYFIKHYTVSHFAIFSPPQSATQIEIRLTLLKHSCESSRRWKNVFGISAHVFYRLTPVSKPVNKRLVSCCCCCCWDKIHILT